MRERVALREDREAGSASEQGGGGRRERELRRLNVPLVTIFFVSTSPDYEEKEGELGRKGRRRKSDGSRLTTARSEREEGANRESQ